MIPPVYDSRSRRLVEWLCTFGLPASCLRRLLFAAPKRSKKERALKLNQLSFSCSSFGEKNSVEPGKPGRTSLKQFFSVPTSSGTLEASKLFSLFQFNGHLNRFQRLWTPISSSCLRGKVFCETSCLGVSVVIFL